MYFSLFLVDLDRDVAHGYVLVIVRSILCLCAINSYTVVPHIFAYVEAITKGQLQ